jgi:hypothetical protein
VVGLTKGMRLINCSAKPLFNCSFNCCLETGQRSHFFRFGFDFWRQTHFLGHFLRKKLERDRFCLQQVTENEDETGRAVKRVAF